ncbi:MAG: hypothetical protein M1829_004677 [Trizodia sp. TS-e1964]|nr:MAG: hypothetical protein M1829_004677 [Trizodia sp. TS-e1964]
MAEQSTHDVVIKAQSVGDSSPSDVPASISKDSNTLGAEAEIQISTESTTQPQPVAHSHVPQISTVDSIGISVEQDHGEEKPLDGPPANVEIPSGSSNKGEVSALGLDDILTNGDTVGPLSGDDGSLRASAEASGCSDSDTGKPERGCKEISEIKGHNRSQSVKKPAPFKAVSVTKNFLAKAAAGSTPSSKLGGDKASTHSGLAGVSQSGARLRFVARAGSGLRDVTSKSGSFSNGTGKVAHPDAGLVWNKNRPVPPPPPKQFTDEELKQQYGIHLATRLQADEAGKEAKWADIDDDDDDWAPETIEWNDGTKITLPQAEEASVAPVVNPQLTAHQFNHTDAEMPISPVLEPVGPTLPTDPTIQKNVTPTYHQPKLGGLILKGATEKPTLVARPPGPPAPIKSPWASLPPVDKVSPIAVLPQSQPPQHYQQRFGQRDPHSFDAMIAPPSPAHEIAADDFNRSSFSATNKELYNSHSGRYEPAQEGRRGSIRSDQQVRQHSVLQRPPNNDQQGPAEPSAAFQTSRSTGQPDSGRRRTSSNVSGGSGMLARRTSFGKSHDMPPNDFRMPQRRGSHHISTTLESPASPRNFSPAATYTGPRSFSPVNSSHQQRYSRPSPIMNHTNPLPPHTGPLESASSTNSQPQLSTPTTSISLTQGHEVEDPVVMQRKIMQESRELARKRRKDEEEREEAARRERIRIKMETLGPLASEKKGTTNDSAPKNMALARDKQPSSQTVPKPPVPETSGEIKQYGMIKVHHAESVKKPISSNQATSQQTINRSPAPSPPRADKNISAGETVQDGSSMQLAATSERMPMEDQEQPWKKAPPGQDKYTSWGGQVLATNPSPALNLWSSPSSDKALGNGTFERSFGGLQSRQVAQKSYNPAPPGAIGPPSALPHSVRPHASAVTSIREDIQTVPHFSPPDARSVPLTDHTILPNSSRIAEALSRPRPIAPPARTPVASRNQRTNAWGNLPLQLAKQEAEEREIADQQHILRLEEEAKGQRREQPAFKETWRQVIVDDGATSVKRARQVVSVTNTVTAADNKAGAPNETQTLQAPPPLSTTNSSPSSHNASLGRGSRFFPPSSDSSQLQQKASNAPSQLSRPASPPPPTTADHPAYEGDIRHPHVLLPRTPIVVRLPPATCHIPKPALKAPEVQRSIPPSQSIDWQDRISNLLGKKPVSPPKAHVLAVNSASIPPPDAPLAQSSATVSLPTKKSDGLSISTQLDGHKPELTDCATTRENAEALLEDREFGSLPVVNLPKIVPDAARHPAPLPAASKSKLKFGKHVLAVMSIPIAELSLFSLKDIQDQRGDLAIPICLPGTGLTKSVIQARSRGSNHRLRNSSSGRYTKRNNNKNNSRQASAGNLLSSMRPSHRVSRPPFASADWTRRVPESVK